MSAYDDYDEPRRYRTSRVRPRERDEPEFVREETYIERGKGPGPRDLVFRGRDDSVEDIPRDFPPPGRDARRSYDEYSQAPRRTRSVGRRDYDDYDDDRYTDYAAPAAAGGAAGYAAGRRKEKAHRHRRDDRDYYDSEHSRSPPRKDRRKSGVEDLLGGLGLGGLVGAVTGNKDKSRDHSRSDRSGRSKSTRRGKSRGRGYDSDSRSRSRSRGDKKGNNERQWAQAAQAALIAGAVEAFRSRKEPGPWTGDKGRRIATAAIGAGGINKLVDRDPDEKKKRHVLEGVVGGLAASRLANGARSKSRTRGISPDGTIMSGRTGRSRSRSIIDRFRGRSQSRGRGESPSGGGGGLKGLVAGGALAAAGKAVYDRVRSKSRKRRSPSSSSADSYVPSRNRRRDGRRSPRSDTGSTRRSQGGNDRGLATRDTRDTNSNYNNSRALAAGGAAGAGAGALAKRGNNGSTKNGGDEEHQSDSSSTTDLENKRKRMRGKEILTAGLATIATVHAAHGLYSSMEAHEKRHKLVAEGEMTREEARKKQTKAWVQDAAAVGIAALGIKGAFSEWKEMNEQRGEVHAMEARKRARMKRNEKMKRQQEDERQERMMQLMAQNPQTAMMIQGMQGGGGGSGMPQMPQFQPQAPRPDQSGNPYAPRDGGRG
ncbi:hypothetical protein B0A48_08153 [Cryoendolithus antarcticus]|uniref:Uncharacterized protein n=1 Tax=Cryoendolithus antarcticus TaxID=1507870 RepID=A0A1V8T140_9PEZI|nr:hypothetical protein B0A48_08153 [Cryoendolithus antarcticus]